MNRLSDWLAYAAAVLVVLAIIALAAGWRLVEIGLTGWLVR